jgi:hypothetical protein
MFDHKHFERAAKKILDVFSDNRITNHDLMHVAFYTVANAYPEYVLDSIVEFSYHIEEERKRIKAAKDLTNDFEPYRIGE